MYLAYMEHMSTSNKLPPLITNLVAREDNLWHRIPTCLMVRVKEHEKIHLKRESHLSSFLWPCPPCDTCLPACPRRPRPRPARRPRTWQSTVPPRAASTRTCDMTREDCLYFHHIHMTLCVVEAFCIILDAVYCHMGVTRGWFYKYPLRTCQLVGWIRCSNYKVAGVEGEKSGSKRGSW